MALLKKRLSKRVRVCQASMLNSCSSNSMSAHKTQALAAYFLNFVCWDSALALLLTLLIVGGSA